MSGAVRPWRASPVTARKNGAHTAVVKPKARLVNVLVLSIDSIQNPGLHVGSSVWERKATWVAAEARLLCDVPPFSHHIGDRERVCHGLVDLRWDWRGGRVSRCTFSPLLKVQRCPTTVVWEWTKNNPTKLHILVVAVAVVMNQC